VRLDKMAPAQREIVHAFARRLDADFMSIPGRSMKWAMMKAA
jgi:hypothetical protein